MNDNKTPTLYTLFQSDTGHSAPSDLLPRVYEKIARAERLKNIRETYIWGSFFVFSLSSFVASAVYATQEFRASNFGSYFSLLFSDGSTVLHLWREVGLSLIESLPLISVIAVLASVSVLLWALRKISNVKPALGFTMSVAA